MVMEAVLARIRGILLASIYEKLDLAFLSTDLWDAETSMKELPPQRTDSPAVQPQKLDRDSPTSPELGRAFYPFPATIPSQDGLNLTSFDFLSLSKNEK